jgi:hypothetical protein
MKNITISLVGLCGIFLILFLSCNEDEVMLVTDRTDCYISRFQVRGTDNYTILADVTIGKGIDTTALTINAIVKYGTDITRLKPNCSLASECSLTPFMGEWTDFTNPRQYTVVSGNRKIKKTYTITVIVQP